MSKPERKRGITKGRVLMVLGLVLILGAGGLLGYNQWLNYTSGEESDAAAIMLVEEIQSKQVEALEVELTDSNVPAGASPEMLKIVELNGAYYMGVLTIPKLERLLPIQSDWSMEKLEHSPCRYSGSLSENNLVLAGHNYKRHFNGIAQLERGDSIVFTDLDGQQTFYEVKEVYTSKATDIEGMINSKYDLTLFTCNYTGKARVTVRCNEVE